MKIIADANIPFIEKCLQGLGSVEVTSGREITPEKVKDAQALLVRSITKVNEQLLEGSSVKFVGTATIGTDHIDLDYLAKNGIAFSSAPGSNANSVAEYVTAALLELAETRRFKLEGMSIGIIGAGNVGSRVARKAQALGMNVYLNDPPLARETGDARYLPIDNLYGCDILTMHTPLTYEGLDSTFHLAGEAFFDSLKGGAIFINTARGPVMDSSALKSAIRTGKLGSVVLDVWEDEPEIDLKLLKMVDIASPHIAGYSFDGKVRGMIMIYKAMCKCFGIEPNKNESDFLPEPENKKVTLPAIKDEQSVIANAVGAVYDIMLDDMNMRKMQDQPDPGPYFDKLRKEYRIRREFSNTRIIAGPDQQGAFKKLRGIGFVC